MGTDSVGFSSSSSSLTSIETTPKSATEISSTADQLLVPLTSSNAANDKIVPETIAVIKQESIDLTVPRSPGSREVIELTDSEDEEPAGSGPPRKIKEEVLEITLPTNLGVIELFDSDEELNSQPASPKVNTEPKFVENQGLQSVDLIQSNRNTEDRPGSASVIATHPNGAGDPGALVHAVGQVSTILFNFG